MTDPTEDSVPVSSGDPTRRQPPEQPKLAVGMALLAIAAALIVVVLVQPAMAGWLKATIGVLAILVVATLLAYAVRLWKTTQRGGRR